jgi:hypothetical protein
MIPATLDPAPNGTPTANGEHATRSPDTPPPSGRDAHGRFTKGNAGGPGNPFARQSAAIHRAFRSVVSQEKAQALALKLMDMAMEGNLAAAKLLLTYGIGRPQEAVNPDSLDIQEWALWRQAPGMSEEMPKVIKCLTAEQACLLAREIQPEVSQEMLTQLAQGMQQRNDRDAAARERKQARQEQKAAAAPMQTETAEKPVETPAQPPSRNGENGSDRHAHKTPEELVEEIRSGRYQQAQADAAETPTATRVTEEKPVESREQPPSGNGANGSGPCSPLPAETATGTRQTEEKPVETRRQPPSPLGGTSSGRYDHMSAEEILEEIRNGRYLLPPEEARRARQQGRQQQPGTDTNGANGGMDTPPPSPKRNSGGA